MSSAFLLPMAKRLFGCGRPRGAPSSSRSAAAWSLTVSAPPARSSAALAAASSLNRARPCLSPCRRSGARPQHTCGNTQRGARRRAHLVVLDVDDARVPPAQAELDLVEAGLLRRLLAPELKLQHAARLKLRRRLGGLLRRRLRRRRVRRRARLGRARLLGRARGVGPGRGAVAGRAVGVGSGACARSAVRRVPARLARARIRAAVGGRLPPAAPSSSRSAVEHAGALGRGSLALNLSNAKGTPAAPRPHPPSRPRGARCSPACAPWRPERPHTPAPCPAPGGRRRVSSQRGHAGAPCTAEAGAAAP